MLTMQPRARLQPGARRGADAHRAVEVDVDRLGERDRVVLGAAADDAGAVDDDVELAEPVDQRAHRVAVADVEPPHVDAPAAPRAASTSASVAPVATTASPRGGERARDAGADAAGGAGDEDAARCRRRRHVRA